MELVKKEESRGEKCDGGSHKCMRKGAERWAKLKEKFMK